MSRASSNRASRRGGLVLPVAALALAVLLPLAVLLGSAFLMGWRFHAVETGSMAPHYPAGALAIIEPFDPADVRPGMTIVFEDPLDRTRFVAHRVVRRLPGSSPVWATKGDANAENDPAPVHATALRGRVRWAIPELGRAMSALRREWVVVLLVGLPLSILALTEIAALRRRRALDAMASYLVESYLTSAGDLLEAAARMRAAAEASSVEGVPVRYLRSIFVPEDETCFHLLEGPSAEVVQQVGERAGLVGNRVVEAIA